MEANANLQVEVGVLQRRLQRIARVPDQVVVHQMNLIEVLNFEKHLELFSKVSQSC